MQQQPSRRCSLPLLLALAAVAAATASASGPGLGCGFSWQQDVCRGALGQFSFSDGCNTVTCDGRGEYITTLMMCPEANTEAEKRQCQNIRRSVQDQVEAGWSLSCPLLSMSSVCATAPKGFAFNDGCNTVICDGSGRGSTTMMACQEPRTRAEVSACERRTQKLVERLEQRTCNGLNSTAICLANGVGFRFSDGCNGIECGLSGQWQSTLMFCPEAPPSSLICRWVQARANPAAAEAARAGLEGREFACPSLAVARICTAKVVGFRYNDGCNSVHCVSAGSAVSSFRLCEPPSDKEAEAAATYCSQKEAEMRQKRDQSQLRNRCLSASDVCKTGDERKAYFDGCNYCFCMGAGRAGCTRRACQPYFSTEEEFAEECKRRKVGIIN